jgi:hypothetical protein
VKDVSGSISRASLVEAISFGGEYVAHGSGLSRPGEFFGAFDASYRSSFSSSASASKYLVVDATGC